MQSLSHKPCARNWRQGLSESALLKYTGFAHLDLLWQALAKESYPTYFPIRAEFSELFPHQNNLLNARAESASQFKVNLLGSGWIDLGQEIDWHCDYKSGKRWPLGACGRLRYADPNTDADVKFPWELSRLQWLIPVAQRYLLHRNEQDAGFIKNILSHWMQKNPYAYSINWSCSMEVALRIVIFTWFFHVFKFASSWQDHDFRLRFLGLLYQHAEFVSKHIEYSDINGNHYTANACGLVFAGLFFLEKRRAKNWLHSGWKILNKEILKQVYPDGVNFEGSIAYHRLNTELFLLSALYAKCRGHAICEAYENRLIKMAKFVHAYSRYDGSSPLIGDADDGRVLPLGTQDINDHRYLCQWVGWHWQQDELLFDTELDEIYWHCGATAIKPKNSITPISQAFKNGGFYILRHQQDHVFISCGNLGNRGRGGHSHNDALSLEIMLAGELIICDAGCYVYTADFNERNLFRSTAYHNTPQINAEEINRFVHPRDLWSLHNDAKAELVRWESHADYAIFHGRHSAYCRFRPPVVIERSVNLAFTHSRVKILDHFHGVGNYSVSTPFHFAPQVEILNVEQNILYFKIQNKIFYLTWSDPAAWQIKIQPARISPSYGVIKHTKKIVFIKRVEGLVDLTVIIGFNEQIAANINLRQTKSVLPPQRYDFGHK